MQSIETAFPIIEALKAKGHQAFLVGGCVRDHLFDRPTKDVDVATSATPDEVGQIFQGVKLVGASFGVCLVPAGDEAIEVATFRRDGVYMDGRRPEDVVFGSMEEDAARRDFTINALYMTPEGAIIDHVGGMVDFCARLLRCVGDPQKRFQEDALRLLRAIRFASRLGLTIEDETWKAMVELAPTITRISAERQREEITRMLMHESAFDAMKLMVESGLMEHLLPEVTDLAKITDQGPHHPEGDALTHTLLCVKNLERRSAVLGWVALLHDIGKAKTFSIGEDGIPHFYEHAIVGADMARVIVQRFKFSLEDQEAITRLVYRHMLPLSGVEGWKKKTFKRFLGDEQCEDLLTFSKSDILSSSGDMSPLHRLEEAREEFVLADEPVRPDPLIGGRDLIELGYKPGPLFSTILTRVEDEQLEGELSTREDAIVFVQEHFPST